MKLVLATFSSLREELGHLQDDLNVSVDIPGVGWVLGSRGCMLVVGVTWLYAGCWGDVGAGWMLG